MRRRFHTALGLLPTLLIMLAAVSFQTLSAADNSRPLVDVVIPAPFVRALLPADGEVVSFMIKSNVWPQNRGAGPGKGPFFQNETAEFALGLAIRAKQGDRGHQASMLPGVTMKNGFVELQGGWRLHKKVDGGPRDFFDGAWRGRLLLAYAGGSSHAQAVTDFSWNPSFLSRIAFPVTAVIYPVIKQRVTSDLERRVSADLPQKMDALVTNFLASHNLPPGMKEHVLAVLSSSGIRIRVFQKQLKVQEVMLPRLISNRPGSVDRNGQTWSLTVTVHA